MGAGVRDQHVILMPEEHGDKSQHAGAIVSRAMQKDDRASDSILRPEKPRRQLCAVERGNLNCFDTRIRLLCRALRTRLHFWVQLFVMGVERYPTKKNGGRRVEGESGG